MKRIQTMALAVAVALPMIGAADAQIGQPARNYYKLRLNATAKVQTGLGEVENVRINQKDVIEEVIFALGPVIPETRVSRCDLVAQVGNDEEILTEVDMWLICSSLKFVWAS